MLYISRNKLDSEMVDIYSTYFNKSKNKTEVTLYAVAHENILDELNISGMDLDNAGEATILATLFYKEEKTDEQTEDEWVEEMEEDSESQRGYL